MSEIPEIDLTIRSIPIKAKCRKLKAKWTVDLHQDIESYHAVGLFDWLLNINGEEYINEPYAEKYKDWKLPIARIVCRLKKKK